MSQVLDLIERQNRMYKGLQTISNMVEEDFANQTFELSHARRELQLLWCVLNQGYLSAKQQAEGDEQQGAPNEAKAEDQPLPKKVKAKKEKAKAKKKAEPKLKRVK